MLNENCIRVALERVAAKIEAGEWGGALAALHELNFERLLESIDEQETAQFDPGAMFGKEHMQETGTCIAACRRALFLGDDAGALAYAEAALERWTKGE